MIERYTRKPMGDIWTEENKYRTWLEVEILACEAMAELGMIPEEAAATIRKKADFSVQRIEEIENETRHDVIAFLTAVAEHVGPEARYIHLGMTSSDVLDTANAVRFQQAGKIIAEDIDRFMEVLRRRAMEHKNTVMVGRSHGIHAEPVTFGLKLAVWYDEMRRNRERFSQALETISYGMISGAVGTFANIPPEVEEHVCRKLGLKPAPASTQVIQRDRYAFFFSTLAVIAATIEKIAVEIRHLQRTEVLEAEEFFSRGQKGSSAMPHKRNPIGSENLTGLARLIRSNAMAALENVALWHERDISHSSVERVIAPDSTILMDYMLARMTGILDKLVVYPETMKKNLDKLGGLIFSQQVLIALAGAGVSRENAYSMVQKNAMEAWKGTRDFQELIMEDQEIRNHLSMEKIKEVFDLDYHLKYISRIFERVFSE